MTFQQWRLTKGYGTAAMLHLLLNGPTLALAQAPVFTMKSDTHFTAPETSSDVGANDVNIVEQNGIDVTFGSDWSKRIREVVQANCPADQAAPSSQCQEKVKEVLGLGTTENGLQARMIPLLTLAGAAIAQVIAALIMTSGKEEYEVLHVHIPQEQNEEM